MGIPPYSTRGHNLRKSHPTFFSIAQVYYITIRTNVQVKVFMFVLKYAFNWLNDIACKAEVLDSMLDHSEKD